MYYNINAMYEETEELMRQDSDSNFDYQQLLKKPEPPKLLKYTSHHVPQPMPQDPALTMFLTSDSPPRRREQQAPTVVLQIVPERVPELAPADPKPAPEPPAVKPKPAPKWISSDRIALRSPRTDKKPIKFAISDDSISPSGSSLSQLSLLPCHCTKTHCLKLYCSCFHNNRICGATCACTECHNDQTHADERKDAVDFVRSKGVKAHEIDKFDTSQVWGCKCRKTHCLKRYCECFIRNKKCTSHCRCEGCENRRVPPTKKKIKHTNPS